MGLPQLCAYSCRREGAGSLPGCLLYTSFRAYIEGKWLPFYSISAATRQGVDALIDAVAAQLDQLPPIRQYEPEPAPQPEPLEGGKRPFTIRIEDGVYIVEADWLMSSCLLYTSRCV